MFGNLEDKNDESVVMEKYRLFLRRSEKRPRHRGWAENQENVVNVEKE